VPNAKIALPIVYDFLEENGITVWLDWGTLLGAYREGEFIVYDHDIDLGITYEGFKKLQEVRLGNPEKQYNKDIIFGAYVNAPDNIPTMMSSSHSNVKIDIYAWFKKGDNHNLCMFYNKEKKKYVVNTVPAHYHENLVKFKFLDREYMIPEKTEEYLTFLYTENWKNRVKSGGHSNSLQSYMVPEEIMEQGDREEE